MTRQRILLIVLLAWALVMIVPDVLRVVQPLGSFGFYADNDGMIYEVIAPFDEEHQSPAWNAGIREGDKLALSKLRSLPYDPTTCGNALDGAWWTSASVLKGQQATFEPEGGRRPPSAADCSDRGAGPGQPVRALHRAHRSDRGNSGGGRRGMARAGRGRDA